VKITKVDVTVVAVPYKPEVGAIVTAGLVLTEARHVLLTIYTDEGLAGIGEAVPRPSVYGETVDSIVAALRDLLVPPILHTDPLGVERMWERWARVVGNTTAKAALDMACHDLCGRAANLPLYQLLGGYAQAPLPLTMPIAIAPDDEVLDQARAALATGYAGVKLKVGKGLHRDIRVVERLREAIGPDMLLYVDANQGYGTTDALKAAAAFGRIGVDLLEEPVSGPNVQGRARIAQTGHVPLLLDESIQGLPDAVREIGLGTAGAFSVRSPRTGITLSKKLIGLADAAEVPCLVGSHRELGVATAASAQLAAGFAAMTYPSELGVHTLLTDGLLAEPLEIDGGRLTLPTGPGLGVDLDPARVAKYRVGNVLTIS
jgi:L-alanine-DL-glutamate epimerase-like enolase superfamily enzyme